MINNIGENTRELKSVNGHRIYKCTNDNGDTFYDVYELDEEWFETFKTLKEAQEYARAN